MLRVGARPAAVISQDAAGTRDTVTEVDPERANGASERHALGRKFLGAIEAFTRGMPQTDDITFVVVEKCQ